MVDPVGR